MHWLLIVIIVFGLLLVVIWPFYQERRKPKIGPTERHGATGEFAQLSQGVTHYRWTGSSRGPVAIVIHGMATPMVAMEELSKGLGTQGYRVLMYDLYGRGLSDAPRGLQNRAFFLRQLSDLIAYLGLREDVTLVGYSVGGNIATAFATENPALVKQLILIASGGILVNTSWFSRFCQNTPLLGDWLHGMLGERRIEKSIPLYGKTKEIDRVLRSQRKELKRRGYLPALLSTRRGILSEIQEKEHRQLGKQGIPVVAVWGGSDPIVPLRALGNLAEWNRAAKQEVVKLADHGLPYTHSEQTAEAIRSLLHD